MPRQPRRQYLVNGSVQGRLLARVAIYWVFCLIGAMAASTGWMMLFDPPASLTEFCTRVAYHIAPMLMISMLLLPIVLLDCLRFSNRFVGPLFRLTRAMDRLADGERVHSIEFRQGDFWFSIAQTFNRLNERVIRLEQQVKTAERTREESSLESVSAP